MISSERVSYFVIPAKLGQADFVAILRDHAHFGDIIVKLGKHLLSLVVISNKHDKLLPK